MLFRNQVENFSVIFKGFEVVQVEIDAWDSFYYRAGFHDGVFIHRAAVT